MRVNVNQAEYEKFCYLIKTVDAVDRAHSIVKCLSEEMRSQDGVKAEMEFDWLNVVRHVTPQLQVVFLRDSHRYEEDRTFVKFPCAIVVVRTAVVVDLNGVFELTLEESPIAEASKVAAAEAVRTLRSYARSAEGNRAMNAEQLLHQLSRALAIK